LAAHKISPLARYYKEGELHCQSLLRDFVMTLAYHAQEMYTTFKAILGEIIRFPGQYVRSAEERQMVKFVLEDQLISINEAMKSLFLDKYFFPFGRGYGVKLLKIEELADHSKDFVNDLLFALPIKVRRPKKQTLDQLLFDQQGKLNPEVITTLAQIRLGD
jgi:hypothetical protein